MDNFDLLAAAATNAKTRRVGLSKKGLIGELDRLLCSPHVLVVAAALRDPAGNRDFPKALVPRFGLREALAPLRDAMPLLRRRAEQDRREGFLEQLPRLAPRVEGLHRLAAGNPRLLVFLYECLGRQRIPELVELVQQIVDVLTPMYQDVLDARLNRGQAAVLENLVQMGGVGRAGDVAARMFVDGATVRDALGELCALGLVLRRADQDLPGEPDDSGKAQVYRTHPPLFQVWYEMRFLPQGSSQYLVRFFSLLVELHEAREALAELDGLSPGSCCVLQEVLDVLDPEWREIRREHVQETLAGGGTLREAQEALTEALAATPAQRWHRRTGLLMVRSQVRERLGDYPAAEQDLAAAEGEVPEAGDTETRVKLALARSRHHHGRWELERAEAAARLAVAYADALATSCRAALQALGRIRLSALLQTRRDFQAAIDLGREAVDLGRDSGDSAVAADAHTALGDAYRADGRVGPACHQHEAALGEATRADDVGRMVRALVRLVDAAIGSGEAANAKDYARRAVVLAQERGDDEHQADALIALAQTESRQDAAASRSLFSRAHRQAHASGAHWSETAALLLAGGHEMRCGENDRAIGLLTDALRLAVQPAGSRIAARIRLALGDAHARVGDPEKAEEHLALAREWYAAVQDREAEAECLWRLGHLAGRVGDTRRVAECYGSALALAEPPQLERRHLAGLIGVLFQTVEAAVRAERLSDAESGVDAAAPGASHGLAAELLAGFTTHLLVPALRASRGNASVVADLLRRLVRHPAFDATQTALRPLHALLRYYEQGCSQAALDELGPTELALVVRPLIERIERPQLARGRELVQAGAHDQARDVLATAVAEDPADDDARLLLAQALLRLGDLDGAGDHADVLLRALPPLAEAVLPKARLLRAQARPEEALAVLDGLTARNDPPAEALDVEAELLLELGRLEDRTRSLARRLEIAEDATERSRVALRLVATWLALGDPEQARRRLPADDPEVLDGLLGLRREVLLVVTALLERDPAAAREHAAAALLLAADRPPGTADDPFEPRLGTPILERLDERDRVFLGALLRALTRRQDPVRFAEEYLGQAEVEALLARVDEEASGALAALADGRIQVFEDLLRVGTRSVAPAAALTALGGAFAEQPPARREMLTALFLEALDRGEPPTVVAAFGALGQNFRRLEAADRKRALTSIVARAVQEDADPELREQGLDVLGALYPNLDAGEQETVRAGLAPLRGHQSGRILATIFDSAADQEEAP